MARRALSLHPPRTTSRSPVDYAAAAQFNGFLGDLARRVANDPERPHYVSSSFFARFEKERGQ